METYWITAKVTKEQKDAVNIACEMYDCKTSDFIRILISPFVFAQDSSEVPIQERDWNNFRQFIEQCARMRKAL